MLSYLFPPFFIFLIKESLGIIDQSEPFLSFQIDSNAQSVNIVAMNHVITGMFAELPQLGCKMFPSHRVFRDLNHGSANDPINPFLDTRVCLLIHIVLDPLGVHRKTQQPHPVVKNWWGVRQNMQTGDIHIPTGLGKGYRLPLHPGIIMDILEQHHQHTHRRLPPFEVWKFLATSLNDRFGGIPLRTRDTGDACANPPVFSDAKGDRRFKTLMMKADPDDCTKEDPLLVQISPSQILDAPLSPDCPPPC